MTLDPPVRLQGGSPPRALTTPCGSVWGKILPWSNTIDALRGHGHAVSPEPFISEDSRVLDPSEAVTDLVPALIEFRRRLHANPEPSRAEYETTETILARLRLAGLSPFRLGGGTGVVCDVGPVEAPYVVLRADIDALAVEDLKAVPYRSRVP